MDKYKSPINQLPVYETFMPVDISSKALERSITLLNQRVDGYFFFIVALLPEYNPFALNAPIIPKKREILGTKNEEAIPINTPIKGIY